MAISRAVAAEQIRRFRAYPNFPEDRTALEALIHAMQESCADEAEAQAIGDQLERSLRFAPLPADIYEAASERSENRAAMLTDWKGFANRCETCQDTGWQIARRGAVRCPECNRQNG